MLASVVGCGLRLCAVAISRVELDRSCGKERFAVSGWMSVVSLRRPLDVCYCCRVMDFFFS